MIPAASGDLVRAIVRAELEDRMADNSQITPNKVRDILLKFIKACIPPDAPIRVRAGAAPGSIFIDLRPKHKSNDGHKV